MLKSQWRKPHRFKVKKSIFRNKFFWYSILFLLILFGFFYFLFFSSFFQIKEIQVSGNLKVKTEEIKNIIQPQLEKKFLFISTRSIFLTDFKKIKEIISESFPLVATVSMKRDFPDIIISQIEEKKAVAAFCQNGNCWFLDSEGVIFEKITEAPRDFLKLRIPAVKGELKVGEVIIEKEELSRILEIEKKLKTAPEIPTEEFILVFKERLNVRTADGWEIYFNPQEDINWQITKLAAVLEEKIPPENRKDLEYIELRFGNFAPFKYK